MSGGQIASVARLIIGVVPVAIEPQELHRLSLNEYNRLIEGRALAATAVELPALDVDDLLRAANA